MKRLVVLTILALASSQSAARDLTLILNDQDQQTLVQALDAVMKVQGLVSLTNGTASAVQALYQKLQAAAQTTDKQAPNESKP